MISNLYIREICLKDNEVENRYPFNLPIIKNFNGIKMDTPVTFIMGDNGTGKSTLLEAIAVACRFNPEGGSKNFNFNTKETHSVLHKHLRIVKGVRQAKDGFFLRAESFYNVATEVDDLYDVELSIGAGSSFGDKSLHKQSHGESFLALMQNRLRGNGLYIFDEPEAALSATGQLKMLRLMKELVDKNSQFIIATHSPIISAFPDAKIYEANFDEFVLKDYEDTENYIVTKYFLNNADKMLCDLLEE